MCNNQKGHIHAALMLAYAQDAAVMEFPWEKWEYFNRIEATWNCCTTHPYWDKGVEYRRKKDYRLINGFKVPCPLPKGSQKTPVFTPSFASVSLVDYYSTRKNCDRLISRGIGFATFKEAVATAKALLGIDPEWY